MICKDCGNTKKFVHSYDARVTEEVLNGEVVETYSFLFDDCDENWECGECGGDNIDTEGYGE